MADYEGKCFWCARRLNLEKGVTAPLNGPGFSILLTFHRPCAEAMEAARTMWKASVMPDGPTLLTLRNGDHGA